MLVLVWLSGLLAGLGAGVALAWWRSAPRRVALPPLPPPPAPAAPMPGPVVPVEGPTLADVAAKLKAERPDLDGPALDAAAQQIHVRLQRAVARRRGTA